MMRARASVRIMIRVVDSRGGDEQSACTCRRTSQWQRHALVALLRRVARQRTSVWTSEWTGEPDGMAAVSTRAATGADGERVGSNTCAV